MNNYVFFTILIVASILGLIFFFTSIVINREKTLYSVILGFWILCWSLILLSNALLVTDFYLHFPYLYKSITGLGYLLGPLSYLYIRSTLKQSFRLTFSDSLFFIPFILYLIHRVPFYLLNYDQKLVIIREVFQSLDLFLAEREGLFPALWVSYFRLVFTLIFSVAQCKLLYEWYVKYHDANEAEIYKANLSIFKWLCVFSGIIFIYVLLIAVLAVVKRFSGNVNGFLTLNYLNAMGIISFYVYSLMNPKILYGMVGWFQTDYPAIKLKEANEIVNTSGDRFDRLSPRNGQEILDKIKNHFDQNLSFLTLGYALSDLSREIKVPSYLISTLINQEFGLSFREYITNYRIVELERMIREDPKFDLLTIEAIGQKLGFRSRTSLVDAIKSRSGQTPKEFIQQRRQQPIR
jgi:AraC-like DNA-binding protein